MSNIYSRFSGWIQRYFYVTIALNSFFSSSRLVLERQIILGVLLLFFAGEVGAQCVSPFMDNTPGLKTFTVPFGVTEITVETWGGGGRGSTRTTTGSGGGGGGGAYSRSVLSVTPGQTYTYEVGGGSNSTAPGGSSRFYLVSGTDLVRALGGNSVGNNNTAGASGGDASGGVGDIRYSGGSGANAVSPTTNSRRGGGGGGAAGALGDGADGSGRFGGSNSNGGGDGGTANNNNNFNGNGGSLIGGGGSGAARGNGTRNGGSGANGEVRITFKCPYQSEIISANFGSSDWCPGETRDVEVTIRNVGGAVWTDGSGGTPTINIGVKWNTNGASWADYNVRTSAGNLAPGETRTYTITLTASNKTTDYTSDVYGGPLNPGNNALTFDVVNEGQFWFGNNNNGGGPGNSVFTTSTISIGQEADVQNMSAVACSGIGFSVTPENGTNGTIPSGTTYEWSAPTVSGGVTGGTSGSGPSITGTLFNPTNINQSATYTVTPITNGCAGSPFTVTLLINPTAEITPIDLVVCSDDPFTVIPTNGTNGAVPASTTYTWTVPTVTGGMTGGLAGSGSNIGGTLRNNTNIPQTATYTVTPITGSCVGAPFTITVTVNPRPALTPITAATCSNEAFSLTPINGTNGLIPAGTTYSWSAPSVPAGITGGTAGSGANITGTLINSTNSPLVATYTVTPNSGTCAGNPFTVTVTVNPKPVIPAQTQTICSGQTFTVNPSHGGATILPLGTTYTWTVVDNPNILGASDQATPQSSITQTLINTSPVPQNVTYTVIPRSGSGGNCEGAPFTITVTVNPAPVLASPTVLERCNNTSATYLATTATPGTSFSWSRAAVTGISNAAASGTGASITETLENTTANPIEVTYNYTLTANGCSNTQSVTVTVNPTPRLNSSLNPPAICSNGLFSYTPSSASSGASFSWTRAAVAGISNPAITTPQTSNPNESLVNTTAQPINVVYAFTITANGCSHTENVTVTVNPAPQLNSTLTPDAICSNDTFSYTPSSLTPGATFTWTRAAVSGISNAAVSSPQSTNPNEVLVNTTNNPIDVIYAFTVSANGCTNTQNVRVRVNPTPTLSSNLTPPAICNNSVFNYTPISAVPGATFTWTRAEVPGISNAAVTTPQTSNPNETLINTTANPIDVVYLFSITANGCNNTQSVTVRVNPTPTLNTTLTPDAICSNSIFTYSAGSDTPGASITWTRPAVPGISNPAITTPQTSNPNEVLVNTTANPINVVYRYTIIANGCTNTQDVTVTVNPSPILTSSTNLEICSDAPFTYTATSATPGTGFSWTRAAVSGISNAVASGSGDIVNETLFNTTANPIEVVYVFTLTANGCATTQNVTVTVNPTPMLSSATSLEICEDTAFSYTATSATAGTTFSWTRAAISGISNAAASGADASVNETLVNTTANPIDVVYTFTLTANGCSHTQDVTVTVNPTPTLSSSLTPPPVCGDEVFSYSPSSATSSASFTWTRAAVAGISNAAVTSPQSSDPNEILVNTTQDPIEVIYTYAITANGCTNIQNVSVTVNPTPDIAPITTSICTDDTFTVSPVHGTDGVVPFGTTYTWTVADNPNVTGESNQNIPQSSISQTLTNTSTTPQEVVYTVTPFSGTCIGETFTVTVTVNSILTIETQPIQDDFEVCFGDTFDPISVVAGGSTGLSYQWFSNTTPINSGGIAVPGATSPTFTPLSSSEGISYYYVVVTGPCGTEVSDISGRYFVSPAVTSLTLDLDTNPQTICPGDSFSPLTVEASGANLQYQWYRNTTASTTGGTLISGATDPSFTPPSDNFGPVYYYALASSDCGTVSSSVSGAFAITRAISTAADQTLCVDSPLNPVITHTTTGTTGIGTPIGLPAGVTATWSNGVITISGTPTSSAGSPYNYSIPLIGACGTEVATGTITVNPKAEINNLSQEICTGSPFSITPVNGIDGIIPAGTTYSWTAPSVTGGLTGGAAGSGNSISGNLVNPTNTVQTATYIVTPISGSCAGETFTVTLTVNPSPVIPAQAVAICDESTFTVAPVNAGATRVPAGTTYTWTVVDNPNVSGESNQSIAQSSISQTLTNNSNIPQNVVYTVTPISGTCGGAPFTVTVTVHPSPKIIDLNEVVCSGSAFTISPSNGGANIVPTGTTYTWTVAANPNVTGQSNQAIGQATISQNLTNLTNIPQTVVYTVTPRSGAAGNCVGDPFTVTVTVNPSPKIESFTETICSGDTFTVSPVNGGSTIVPAGTVYTWTVVNNPNVTGESTQTTAQPTISQTLINTSNSPQTVTYTVTPQSGSDGNCAGEPFIVTITVNPSPSLSSSLNAGEICSNDTFTYTPTSNIPGAVFTWTRAAIPGIGNPAVTTPQSSNPNEVLINTTSSPIDVIYTYTITANGCTNTQEVSVKVKPTPSLSSTLTPAEICGNSAFSYTPTSAVSGATFTWTRAAVTGISNPAVTNPQSSNPNEVLINTTNAPIDVVYVFTISANGCSNTENVTVRVNPRPTLSSTLTPQAVCSNTAFTYIPTSGNPSASFSWTRAAVPGIANPAVTTAQNSNPNEILVNNTPNPIDVVYVFTINANGCTNTQNVRVTVNPTPVLNSTLNPPAICSGSEFNYNATTGISGTSITWTRAAVSGISNPAITSPQTGNPRETLINTTSNPIDVVYTYSLTANGCTHTQNVTVRVNPTPTLNSSLNPPAVCTGTAFTYTASSLTPGAAFSWTRATVAGISNAASSGSGTSINETLINTTANPIDVVYAYTITANGCSNTQNVTVKVNPTPLITPSPIALSICSGETFSLIPENGVNGRVPAGTTYTWTRVNNTNVSGHSNQSTPQSSISQTLTNNTTSVQTVTYTVTPRTGTCAAGPTFQVVVTVNPNPTVNAVSNQTLCDGATTAPINFTGNAVAGKTYTWTNSNPGIGLPASGTGNIPAFTARNTGAAPATATITVTPMVNGCAGTPRTFTITVNPSPRVTIVPDYCVVGGKVQLVANSNIPGTTWSWSTSPAQTTQSILVDLSGTYTVTATAPNGCQTTASISVAQELVVNGDFTAGNTGFISDYMFLPDLPGVNNELVPDTGTRGYGVGTNGQNYHPNFWGIDHTNNSVGPRNMMIVNGKGGTLRIWEQTVNVDPDTDYYFSAWAMSVNAAPPYARLRFEVNGVQVGTIAELGPGPSNTVQANANDRWVRFYSDPVWNSGSISGPITIRIVNLEPALGGNDFALDDISFGTLSTFINLTSGPGTDNQTVCQDSPIEDITYTAGSGILGPTVTGLPAGITPVWNGVTLRFSGSPTESGTFTYTITTTGSCAPATATGTITVRSTPSAGTISDDLTLCSGEDPLAISSLIDGTGEAGSVITYRWESNANLISPNWTVIPGQTGASYDPSVLASSTQFRRITIATLGGLTCESEPTNPILITVQSTPTAGAIATDQTICAGDDPAPFTSLLAGTGDGTISYRWESSVSPFTSWTNIGGANQATYDAPAGLVVTTRYRRVTISSVNGVACESAPTAPVQISVNPTNTVIPVEPDQILCVDSSFPSTIIHNTTGATGILPQGPTVDYNLPNGVTANWNAGVITIQGTPTESGIFNYSIPLAGGCGTVAATGTITVGNPSYPISGIQVVNPQPGDPTPATSTFTVFSPGFSPGTYTLIYSTSGINQGPDQTITATVTTPGQLSFSTLSYSEEGTTLLTILSIQKDTDICPFFPPNNNSGPYGINCSAEFTRANGDNAFYVPAGVFEVSIQVFGNGATGNTATQTIPVSPGNPIYVVFSGDDVFATLVPPSEPLSARLAQAIVLTTGPNGRILFLYDCPVLDPCASGAGNVIQYTDSEGYTVLKFSFAGPCTWYAPDGLDEFEVLVVGGGGGGGFGESAGGGGGGGVIYRHYRDISMGGLVGLQGAAFPLFVGDKGLGATNSNTRGQDGVGSIFSGPAFTYEGGNTFSDLLTTGGGGGGSTNSDPSIRIGADGASGGGGAAFGSNPSNGGNGLNGGNGGAGLAQSGGAAGGGGGGTSANGSAGNFNAGSQTATGGMGGIGESRTISGEEVWYGAGGGGTSRGGITNQPGNGGSQYTGPNGAQLSAGGNANNNGRGFFGTTFGSGGGAGITGGGDGFTGVVYIRYPNFRILPVEYAYFKAVYNAHNRSGDLSWATLKEWENDRFEIERAVNNVQNWETLGEMPGAGYSDGLQEYSFQDTKLPLSGGNVFYRLKQFDFNGEYNYSNIKAIKVEAVPGTTFWRVYPNPTNGNRVNLQMIDTGVYNDEVVKVRVISATGNFDVFESSSSIMLSDQISKTLEDKAAGIYIFEISWGVYKEYHKVVVKR